MMMAERGCVKKGAALAQFGRQNPTRKSNHHVFSKTCQVGVGNWGENSEVGMFASHMATNAFLTMVWL